MTHTREHKPAIDPVMILGCGRSGTSIFGELFENLTGFTYRSEPPFCDVVAADFSVPQAFKVPRDSPKFPAKPGLSFPLEALDAIARNMRYFWIVRNPLDAICSLRVGISKNWGHHPRPPDWDSWLDRPIIERRAHHWAFINEFGFDQVQSRATVVHFESMIADPLGFARSICRAINLDVLPEQAAITDWAERVQNTNNSRFNEARTSRSYSREDHVVRVGRWRENLTANEVRRVWPLLARPAERFGYHET